MTSWPLSVALPGGPQDKIEEGRLLWGEKQGRKGTVVE